MSLWGTAEVVAEGKRQLEAIIEDVKNERLGTHAGGDAGGAAAAGGGGDGGGGGAPRETANVPTRGMAGVIIGRGGATIKRLEAESGARLHVDDDDANVQITGDARAIEMATRLVEDTIRRGLGGAGDGAGVRRGRRAKRRARGVDEGRGGEGGGRGGGRRRRRRRGRGGDEQPRGERGGRRRRGWRSRVSEAIERAARLSDAYRSPRAPREGSFRSYECCFFSTPRRNVEPTGGVILSPPIGRRSIARLFLFLFPFLRRVEASVL